MSSAGIPADVHNDGGGDELESTASNACQMSMYQALMATWL
jgi:hypothetical protein